VSEVSVQVSVQVSMSVTECAREWEGGAGPYLVAGDELVGEGEAGHQAAFLQPVCSGASWNQKQKLTAAHRNIIV